MLRFDSAHIHWNAFSNVELRRSYKAWQCDLVLPATTTHSNICWRGYLLTVDAINKQLLLQNNVRLALDGWISINTLAITSVIAHYMDRNLALCEVQLAFDEVDRLIISGFES